MDWSAFHFVEYFSSERFPKWEDWKIEYLDVVDALQMSEDQSMLSMLGLFKGWAVQAVSDLPLGFWLSETGEVVMSLGQYFHIIEKNLSISREQNCDCRNSSRSKRKSAMKEKLESEHKESKHRKILSIRKLVRN